MLERGIERLLGPRVAATSEDDRRRAHLMVVFAVVIIAVGCGGVARSYVADGYPLFGAWMAGTMITSGLAVFTLRFTGNINLAAHQFVGAFMLTFMGGWLLGGGVQSPLYVSLPVALVTAFMLGGMRIGLFWSAIGMATHIGFAIHSDVVGTYLWLLPEDLAMEKRLVEPVPVALGVLLITWAFEKARARAYQSATTARIRAEEARDSVTFILDNAGQGFVALDPEGKIHGPASRILEDWIAKPEEGQSFADFLEPMDRRAADGFHLGWDQVVDQLLPLEVCIAQLPTRVITQGHVLELSYRPVLQGDEMVRAIVVVSDISEQVRREQLEARQRDLMASFQKASEHRRAFDDFMIEASRLVHAVGQGDQTQLTELRYLHTLKGNTALYGMEGFSRLCHDLEDQVHERGSSLILSERTRLTSEWEGLSRDIGSFVAHVSQARLQIEHGLYNRHLHQLRQRAPHDVLAREVELWSYEPTRERFQVLAESATALAKRLDKGEIGVQLDDGGLWIEPEPMRQFWSELLHVVRNAVDHGLETPEERMKCGKRRGEITLASGASDEHLYIEVRDDGRGVDWTRMKEQARAHGIPCETQSDLVAALFHDGLSTREEATTTSGRGVGMAAVYAAMLRLDGDVQVTTELGQGTCFRFSFPRSKLGFGVAPALSLSQASAPSNDSLPAIAARAARTA